MKADDLVELLLERSRAEVASRRESDGGRRRGRGRAGCPGDRRRGPALLPAEVRPEQGHRLRLRRGPQLRGGHRALPPVLAGARRTTSSASSRSGASRRTSRREALRSPASGLGRRPLGARSSTRPRPRRSPSARSSRSSSSTLARHAFGLAQAFNHFYHRQPIVQEPDAAVRNRRLAVARIFAREMSRLLGLLGIPEPGGCDRSSHVFRVQESLETMASIADRLPDNAPGDFFVDRTCIDCDTCRRIAPAVFAEARGPLLRRPAAGVGGGPPAGVDGARRLPDGLDRHRLAPRTSGRGSPRFPSRSTENVSFCGFTSKDSFGAWSYFIERPEGNVLVDSRAPSDRLLRHFEERGGVATMFLTHRDDVADHEAFARRFGCERVLHERRRHGAARASVERKISGSRTRAPGRRPRRDPDARPHARPRRAPLPGEVPLHRRPPRLVLPPRRPRRLPRRLLVLLAGADPLDGAAPRLLLRVGPARPRRLAPCGIPRRDAARARSAASAG